MTCFPVMPFASPSYTSSIQYQGFTFLDGVENTTPVTYSSAPLGAEASNRYIIAVGHTFTNTISSRGISGITLDGVAMTLIDQVTSGSGANAPTCTGIYILSKPTGTTGTVVLNVNGAVNSKGVGVYSLYAPSGTAFATATQLATGINPITTSASLSVPSNGIILAASTVINGTDPTWTSNVTKRYGVDIRSSEWASSASAQGYSGGSPATINPNVAYQTLVTVSFA